MKTILPLVLVLTLLFAPLAYKPAAANASAALDFAAFDAYIESQMDKHGLPGVSLALVQDGQVVYLHGYGTAGSHPMTPQTQMFIGSQSKSFTALAVAQLADQGKIDLNAPVQAYIPWFEVDDEAASSKITVNHLLHHTSGLSEAGFSVVLPDGATPEEAVRALKSARPTAAVGVKFQYLNLGYTVLQYLIETVTGESYAGYIQSHILQPLGMDHSTADPSSAADLSWGYSRLFGFALPMRQPVRQYQVGAGYIVSTAEDLATYAIAMLNRGEANGVSLISPEMARKLFSPGISDYGMGWFASRDGQKIWHGGANETFRTEVNLYPKRHLAFVLLVNEGHLVDHYLSAVELTAGVESLLLGSQPKAGGWSVRLIGWGIGLLVLALCVLHSLNFYRLFHGWAARMSRLSPVKKGLDVAISFLIPTIILVVIFSQLQGFFGYRFNLLTTLAQFRFSVPDIFILMLVGLLPDYIQGVIKLVWIALGKTSPRRAQAFENSSQPV